LVVFVAIATVDVVGAGFPDGFGDVAIVQWGSAINLGSMVVDFKSK
jgi:hypothetical protein